MENKEIRRHTSSNLISGFAVLTTNILINFFLSPYIVKNLGEEANGFVQLANNFIMYASLITIAMNSMGGRFISYNFYKKNEDEVNRLFSSLFIGNIFIILLLIFPTAAFIVNMEDIIRISNVSVSDTKWLFLFAFLNFFAVQFVEVFNISAYVRNKLYISNAMSAIGKLLNALFLIGIFSICSARMYYVSLSAFSASLCLLYASCRMKRKIFKTAKLSLHYFDMKSIFRLLKSGIWNTVNQCGNILMTGLDLLLANLFISAGEMGVLSIAKVIPNVIFQIASTINTSFAPNLTIVYASQKKEALVKQIRSAMKISAILVSACIMLMCVFGKSFYMLWMPTVDAGRLNTLSFLTCMAYIPFAGPQVLYNVFTTTNKLSVNSITFLIGGVINCIAVYLLLKHTGMGIFAVAGVSSLIQILRNVSITVPYAAKVLGLKWNTFYRDVFLSVICCASSFLTGSAVKLVITPHSFTSLIAALILSGAMMILVNSLALLTKEEKKLVIQEIVKRTKR